VGLGRLAGGLGHLTQLWISGDGFGCFLGVRVSSFGWWGGGQVGRCACGFAPAFGRAEPTHPREAAYEWGTPRRSFVEFAMSTPDLQFSLKREVDCRVLRRALEIWLSRLTPMRWFTVSGTTILSAIAAATVFNGHDVHGHSFKTVAGLCALGATILSGLHTALKCDAYQAECSRMINVLGGLEAGFQAVALLDPDDHLAAVRDLEKKYEGALAGTTVSPPHRYKVMAIRELEATGS